MMMTMTLRITIIVADDADEDETLAILMRQAPPLFRERVGGFICLRTNVPSCVSRASDLASRPR